MGFFKRICTLGLGMMAGLIIGGYGMGHKYCLKLTESRTTAEKHLHMVRLYDIWMMSKQSGRSIEAYLIERGINDIAVYGMSYLGIRLFHELKGSSVCVKYGIDMHPRARIPGIRIYHPDDKGLEKVDAVIVTTVFVYDLIKKKMEEKGTGRIIAFDDILYNLI